WISRRPLLRPWCFAARRESPCGPVLPPPDEFASGGLCRGVGERFRRGFACAATGFRGTYRAPPRGRPAAVGPVATTALVPGLGRWRIAAQVRRAARASCAVARPAPGPTRQSRR